MIYKWIKHIFPIALIDDRNITTRKIKCIKQEMLRL